MPSTPPTDIREAEQNGLLRTLPPDELAHLAPLLAPVHVRSREVLFEPDDPIEAVYFPVAGILSVLATRQGGTVEVGTVGHEGFVGLPLLLGSDTMPMRVIGQVDGAAWRLPAGPFVQLVEERPAVRHHLLRYAQLNAEELAQSVACNRLHTLEARCARWLLMTHDRVADDVFSLTHEFLAMMLGVRRAGVTVAMGALQAAGTIRYARGRVSVLDRAGLEGASCPCYGVTRAARERLFGVEVAVPPG